MYGQERPQLFGQTIDVVECSSRIADTFLQAAPDGDMAERQRARQVYTTHLGWAAIRGETDNVLAVLGEITMADPFIGCAVSSNIIRQLISHGQQAQESPTALAVQAFMVDSITDDLQAKGADSVFTNSDLDGARIALLDGGWSASFLSMERSDKNRRAWAKRHTSTQGRAVRVPVTTNEQPLNQRDETDTLDYLALPESPLSLSLAERLAKFKKDVVGFSRALPRSIYGYIHYGVVQLHAKRQFRV